jgi:hypothetical protein
VGLDAGLAPFRLDEEPDSGDVLNLTVALNHGPRIEPARTTAATAMSRSFTGQRWD